MELDLLKHHEFIVFGVEHYNPLGIIRSLGENGIQPVAIILRSKEKISSSSKYIRKLHMVDSVEEGYSLILSEYESKDYEHRPFLLTADDKITGYLDSRYDEIKDKFYFYQAGEQGRINHFMAKEVLCRLAEKHGISIPKTYHVNTGTIPEGIVYPVITKAEDSLDGAWKENVYVCRSEEELLQAFRKIRHPRIIIQQYIEKKNELCLDGYAYNRGKNLHIGIASNYKYILPDRYSSYMDIFPLKDEKLKRSLTEMMCEIGFEGIFSVEFLVDQNDKLYFLEINFRNSTWSYVSTALGMNLVTGWAMSMLEKEEHCPVSKEIPDGYTAMVELQDFKTRVIGRMVSPMRWMKELAASDCVFYYNRQDKKPFYTTLLSKLPFVGKKLG